MFLLLSVKIKADKVRKDVISPYPLISISAFSQLNSALFFSKDSATLIVIHLSLRSQGTKFVA